MADKNEYNMVDETLISCMDEVVKKLCDNARKGLITEDTTAFINALAEYRKSMKKLKWCSMTNEELIHMDNTVRFLCEAVKEKLVVNGEPQLIMALAEYRKSI